MKYESDNIRIKDQDEISGEMEEQITRLQDKMVEVMQSEKVKVQVALSLFATLYAKTARGMMDLPKDVAIEAITGVLEMHYAEDEDYKGEVQWLN